jgi:ABC-type uncharacterized transport system substrate-binding protein
MPVPLYVVRLACIAMALAFAALASAMGAQAHPHVWVTVETEVLDDGQQGIAGFRHTWTFDEFYSSFAIQGMDKNSDGVYDREELKELADVNITSLQEFGFFTFPQLAGQQVECDRPKDYWLEHKDGTLTLHFTLPLKEPAPKAKRKDFHFTVYDPTFYVAFGFAKENPIRMAAGLAECKAEISKPEVQAPAKSLSESVTSQNDKLMGSGQAFAETVRLRCGAAS